MEKTLKGNKKAVKENVVKKAVKENVVKKAVKEKVKAVNPMEKNKKAVKEKITVNNIINKEPLPLRAPIGNLFKNALKGLIATDDSKKLKIKCNTNEKFSISTSVNSIFDSMDTLKNSNIVNSRQGAIDACYSKFTGISEKKCAFYVDVVLKEIESNKENIEEYTNEIIAAYAYAIYANEKLKETLQAPDSGIFKDNVCKIAKFFYFNTDPYQAEFVKRTFIKLLKNPEVTYSNDEIICAFAFSCFGFDNYLFKFFKKSGNFSSSIKDIATMLPKLAEEAEKDRIEWNAIKEHIAMKKKRKTKKEDKPKKEDKKKSKVKEDSSKSDKSKKEIKNDKKVKKLEDLFRKTVSNEDEDTENDEI